MVEKLLNSEDITLDTGVNNLLSISLNMQRW